MAGEPAADGPPRRRASWSLKTIVEDVAGKPIGDFQEPGRPVHPYLRAKLDSPAPPRPPAEPYDPVAHLYPPLVGASARAYHGPEHEHHAETLQRHTTDPPGIGERARSSGPPRRPERLYLHYLLLHLDRLNDAALNYLRTAVDEEIARRSRPLLAPAPTAPAAPVEEPPAELPPPMPTP